jgi:hypothetical protein
MAAQAGHDYQAASPRAVAPERAGVGGAEVTTPIATTEPAPPTRYDLRSDVDAALLAKRILKSLADGTHVVFDETAPFTPKMISVTGDLRDLE